MSSKVNPLTKAMASTPPVEAPDIFDPFDCTPEDVWPEPEEIKSELLPVHPLPKAIIPEALQPWMTDIAERMQCPIDFIAAPALVMTGAAIGTGCGIRPKQRDDWMVIPNLWGAVVSPPGFLKSPAMLEALRPLGQLEQGARDLYKELSTTHEAEREAYEATKAAIKDKMRLAAKKGNALDGLKLELAGTEEPEPLTVRRYRTNDATVEKLHELISQNPRGILVFRDELAGLLSTWDREGHQGDRAFFLEGWSGNGSHTLDRIGRGSVHAASVCVSLFGSIQPSKLLGYLHGAVSGAENDGLVQRLQLLVFPDKQAWEYTDKAPDEEARQPVLAIMKELDSADFTRYGAEPGSPPFFRFDDEAQELFRGWLTDLEKRLRADEDEPIVLEHLAKYRSLMPSLALIFHLMEMISSRQSGPVSLHAAHQAAAWCDYLESHARRVYGLVSNITERAAHQLSKKIRDGKLADGFTVRDIYRAQWALLSNRDVVQSACEELVEKKWLREQVTDPAFQQKSVTRYLINPKAMGPV